MARELVVRIIGDSDSFERALKKSERSARTFSSRMTRHLGAIGVAGGAALGAGIAVGLKTAIDAAMEAEKVLGQTQVALKNVGASWSQYGDTIQSTTTRLSQLAAVNDEDLLTSFQVLLRGTKDVNRALELNATAADLARGRNMDLVSAATLLVKVNAGQLGSARRLGIQLDKTATSQEALAEITRRYAGAAEAYGQSAAGGFDRLKIAVDELAEGLGQVLLPELTKVVDQFNKWLENPENKQGIIDGFTTGVNALAAGYERLAAALQTINDIKMTRESWQEKLGPFGFIIGGPGTIGKQIGQAAENYYDALDKLSGKDMAAPPPAPSAWPNWQEYIKGLVDMVKLLPTGGAGVSGGARAGQFLAPDAFSGPIIKFLDKYKQMNDRIVAAAKAAEQYQTRQETRLGWLSFGLERAEATKRISDDRRWLKKIEAYWKERIAHEGRKLEFAQELWRTQQRLRDLGKKQSDADPLAGLMQVSSKRMANMLAAGTGLDLAGRRVLGANIAGMELRPVYVSVQLEGREIGRANTKDQARTSRRTARQTSGFRG